MGIRPDFIPEHVRQLKTLGVCDEQISELRKALLTVRRAFIRQPSNNDTRDILADVEKLTAKLLKKLESIALQIDSPHDKAGSLIDQSYYQQRPDDDGHTAMLHLVPRLRALHTAARYGLDQIPTKESVRHRLADPAPIKRIHTALITGWHQAHSDGPSYRRGMPCEESESAVAIQKQDRRPRPAYPKRLQPSTSAGCAFRKVVGICYVAVNGTADPERAISEYVGEFKKRRDVKVKATLSLLANRPPKKHHNQ